MRLNFFELAKSAMGLKENRQVVVYEPPSVESDATLVGAEVVHPNYAWMNKLRERAFNDWTMVDPCDVLDVGDLAVRDLGWFNEKMQLINLVRYFELPELVQVMAASLPLMAEGGRRPTFAGITDNDFIRIFTNAGSAAPQPKVGWVDWGKVDGEYAPRSIQYFQGLQRKVAKLRNTRTIDVVYSAMAFAAVTNGGEDEFGQRVCVPASIYNALRKEQRDPHYHYNAD